jgi:hypothetical protein
MLLTSTHIGRDNTPAVSSYGKREKSAVVPTSPKRRKRWRCGVLDIPKTTSEISEQLVRTAMIIIAPPAIKIFEDYYANPFKAVGNF